MSAITAPLAHSPRLLADRQARRWDRQIDRQLQNTEIITLFHQIEREARKLLQSTEVWPIARETVEQILALCEAGILKEREDIARDDQEAGELRLVDRERTRRPS
jgi:hypothetical protein